MAREAGLLIFTSAGATSLNSTASVLRVVAAEKLTVVEAGFQVDGATASGTTLVLTLGTEAGANVGTLTRNTTGGTIQPTAAVTRGRICNRKFDFDVNKGDALILNVTTAAGVAATGMLYIKAYSAGQGTTEYNGEATPIAEQVVTA